MKIKPKDLKGNYKVKVKAGLKNELRTFSLDNDSITKAVTTLSNGMDDHFLMVILPSDFDEWENVVIIYKAKKGII